MKKLIFMAIIALLVIGTVSAQNRGWTPPPPPESVSVEGTLQLQNGQIVLSTGTATYFVPGLPRLIGFIDGLREGARITVEGYAFGNMLRPTKFIVGGREYDLVGDAPEWRQGEPGWGRGFVGHCPMWGAGPRGGPMGGNFGHHGRRGRW